MAWDHEWSRRRRRLAALAGAGLLVAVVVGRRAGLPDPLGGLLLAASMSGVLSWLAASIGRRAGLAAPEAAAWLLGLFLTAVGPVFVSVSPGRELATGTVASPGDALAYADDRSERVLLLASAQLSEPGQVAFDLRAGDGLISGELLRGTRRWTIGEERGHTHVQRASLLMPFEVAAGQVTVVLERSSAPGLSLDLVVYRERFPSWLAAVAGLCALVGFAIRTSHLRGGRDAVMAASASALAGLAAGAAATPVHALGAGLRGVLVGLLAGLPAGAFLALLASWVRRGLGGELRLGAIGSRRERHRRGRAHR